MPEDYNNYDCDHEELCSCKIEYLLLTTISNAYYSPFENAASGFGSVLIQSSQAGEKRFPIFASLERYMLIISYGSRLWLCVVFVLVALYFGFSLNSLKVLICVLAVPVGIVAPFISIASWGQYVSSPWPLIFLLSLLAIAYLRFALNTRYLRCLYYISLIPITLLVFIAILAGEFRMISYTIVPYAIILAIAFDLTFRTLKRRKIQLEEMEFSQIKKFRKGELPPGSFSQWS